MALTLVVDLEFFGQLYTAIICLVLWYFVFIWFKLLLGIKDKSNLGNCYKCTCKWVSKQKAAVNLN